MSELSQETKKLIVKYKQAQSAPEAEGQTTIHVDEVASRVASFYEKIRGIIDWKEEHLLKRSAIERSLKRRIFSRINISNEVFVEQEILAEPLILELIRTGHFPNDEIAENKIGQIQKIIDKYVYLINSSPSDKNVSRIQLSQWLSSIAACEIEEALTPSARQRALMEYMHQSLKEKIRINERIIEEENLTEKDKDIQIYVNTQKALFGLDSSIISYHLLKYQNPDWDYPSADSLEKKAEKIHQIKKEIDQNLEHPLGSKIYQICQKYNTPYLIIGDIVKQDPEQAEEKISKPEEFERLIKENYNYKLKNLKSRLGRAAFYSTLSIFLTNVLALIVLEIPLSKYFWNPSNVGYQIEIFNTTLPITFILTTIFVPTLLMALLVVTIKTPGPGNLEKVVMETIKIAYHNEKKDYYEVKKFRGRSPFFNFFISLIYIVSFFFSLGIIVWALSRINFPPFSYLVFVVFLSLIAFAGVKIREKAKELEMIDQKEGFLALLTDFFALPILYLGKWLSSRWKRYNIVSVFFNALIDMPLSIFIEFLEQWRFFLKEKKEKL
jgi:uncharacterized membrane protein YhaH (DUF805 family)